MPVPIQPSKKAKPFEPFTAFCTDHGNLTVTSLDQVGVEETPYDNGQGGSVKHAYVICGKCRSGSSASHVHVPSKLDENLIMLVEE